MNIFKHIIALVSAVYVFTAFPVFAAPLSVVATIFPLADMARQVGGDAVVVSVLLKPGQGPHTYEPTPGDVRAIEQADVIVMAGFDLEHWLEGLLDMTTNPERTVITCSDAVRNPIKSRHTSKGGHEHGAINLHYWLDPSIMADAALMIGEKLASRMPSEAEAFRRRAKTLAEKLEKLDKEVAARLSRPGLGREYVAFHSAWEYFAARYGLKQVGVIETSPGRKPSAKHFANLVDQIKKYGASAVLVEPQFSPQLGRTLAKEAGVKVVTVDPIGGVAGRNSYIELILWNTGQFEKALTK